MTQAAKAPLASLHDLELAALAAAADRPAFGELARRHGSAVRSLLRRMGADAATADDLAQDAFLTAFERISEFRGEGPFAGWIKRIAARLYLRRARKSLKFEDLPSPDDETVGVGSEQAHAARIDLDGALAGLHPAERLCVSLCYGAGLSHAEAAEALSQPIGTVKSHTRRGLEKLKQRLGVEADVSAGRRTHG